ncbi:hypothetical protein [Sorangium cellulosum]|uniref:Uncharacterized protein n=2 Tax=Sorangium cellulosum TaxID=56 RepID=S4Y7G9_SORCE|nr:hypothetical protein [Sorangium cellulosum]AGP38823.1 hypothetical protein SCE1572_32670 [Sorangium cellulosum So0157-2]
MKTLGVGLSRYSRSLVAAGAAALLSVTPFTASAEHPGATRPAAPGGAPAAAPGAESAPAAEPAATPGAGEWDSYSVEVYGMLVSRAGKVATLRPLVATSATPVAAGTKAVLFRRIEDPKGASPTKYVEIARVTMKKIEATGNMQLTIDSEQQAPAAEKGKAPGHFVKGARLKLAIQ